MLNSKRKGSFVVNIAFQLSNFALTLLTGFFLTPYLVTTLGTSTYSLVPLTLTIVSYFTVLTVAFSTSVSRALTSAMETHDRDLSLRIFSSAAFTCTILSVVLILLSLLAIPLLSFLIEIPSGLETESTLLFLLVSASFILNTLTLPYSVPAFSKNRFDHINGIAALQTLTRVLLLLCLFQVLGPRLSYVGLATFSATLVHALLFVLSWRQLTPELYITPSGIDKKTLSDVATTSWWVAVFQLGTILFLSIDIVVISRFVGSQAAGEYAAVLQLSALLRSFAISVASVFSPTILSLYAQGKIDELIEYTTRAMRFVSLLIAFPIGLLCGFSSNILSLWLGDSFADKSLLLILTVAPLCVNLTVLPLFSVSLAAEKVKVPGILTLLLGVANLCLAVASVYFFDLGVFGVAVSGLIMLTVKNALFTPMYAADNLGKPWMLFVCPLLAQTVTPFVIAAVVCPLFSGLITSWASLLLVSLGLLPIYALLAYFVLLSKADAILLRNTLSRLRSKLA